MPVEPVWVDERVVGPIHQRLIEIHGGRPGVRDPGLLSSALYRPRHLFLYGQESLSALAASYANGLVRNHPFFDGNKRVSFVGTTLFLALNDLEIEARQHELVAIWMQLAAGVLSETSMADWIAQRLRSRPSLSSR